MAFESWIPKRAETYCHPIQAKALYALLEESGFSEAGYYQLNPNLTDYADTDFGLFIHFCAIGMLQRRPFKLSLDGRNLYEILDRFASSGIENKEYVDALIAVFAREFITQTWPTGIPNPVWESSDDHTDEELSELLSYTKFNALPYLVFGDSHSRLYQFLRILPDNKWLLPISMTCSGGSARGLGNENAHLKYGSRIRALWGRMAKHLQNGTKSFFKFGQVDVEYVYTYQWSRSGRTDFDEADFFTFIDESISRYIAFLNSLVSPDLKPNVYVCSILPPALGDEELAVRYVRGHFGHNMTPEMEAQQIDIVRRMNLPDIYKRTQLHLEFNKRLQMAARDANLPFINDADQFLDAEGKKLDPIFNRRTNGTDVHLDRTRETIEPMEKLIRPLVEALPTETHKGLKPVERTMPDYADNGSWVRVRVDKKFAEFLANSKIFSTSRKGQPNRWTDTSFVSFRKSTEVEPYCAIYMGEPLYNMGSFSFVTTPFNINAHGLSISFGRYCSIGGGAQITGPAHPLTAVSTASPFVDHGINFIASYFEDEGIKNYPLVARPPEKGPPIVGHDVWFGGNVWLNTGVKIGNGAAVGVNALVTKDVPDYAIVGGNPARIIRYRFAPEIIQELQDIRPWQYSMKDLGQFDISNIEIFIRQFRAAQHQMTPYTPPKAHLWGAYKSIHGL